MHGHHDSDHYDVQFTTRQLVMLFGLLIVIVVGVFVGGIVIGRGMAPDAAEAMMAARRTSPGPAPPPAKAAPASVAEAPEEDALRLPIRSEPSPAARAAARAPARETTDAGSAGPDGSPRGSGPGARDPGFAGSGPHGLLKPRAAREPDPGDPRTARREPGAGTGGRSAEAGRRREVHHPGRRFPRPRRCRADAGAARRPGNRGLPGGHSGRDLPGARRTVREPRGGPGAGGAARERAVRDPGHQPLASRPGGRTPH